MAPTPDPKSVGGGGARKDEASVKDPKKKDDKKEDDLVRLLLDLISNLWDLLQSVISF